MLVSSKSLSSKSKNNHSLQNLFNSDLNKNEFTKRSNHQHDFSHLDKSYRNSIERLNKLEGKCINLREIRV